MKRYGWEILRVLRYYFTAVMLMIHVVFVFLVNDALLIFQLCKLQVPQHQVFYGKRNRS